MTDSSHMRLLRDLEAMGRLERDHVPASARLEAAIGRQLLDVARMTLLAPRVRTLSRTRRVA